MTQEAEKPRVGVYICGCGLNIAGVVDVKEVAEYAATLPDVAVARSYVYMCSEPGQALIRNDIHDLKINRVVVGSCSPHMHEPTYRRLVEEEGLNRYIFEMANLREQVSWCHAHHHREATEKAKDLIRMAVAKARLLQPLEKREVEVEARGLVVGGGVAGLRAALDIAERGFQACIVERSPFIGGRATQLNRVILTDQDALDVVGPLIDQAGENPNITIYTNSELEEVGGYIGNFEASITQKPRYVSPKCTACGKCAEVCPIEVPDEFNIGLTKRKAIYMPYRRAIPPTYVMDDAACTRCGECVKVCETNAIDLGEKPHNIKVRAGTIIVASGFDPLLPDGLYGFGKCKNVVTQLQLERILSKTYPAAEDVYNPFADESPKNVVFILCAGSRNEERPYCSRICCTVALKNAKLIKETSPESRVSIAYRDIRVFGKRQEEYYEEARRTGIALFRYLPESPPLVEGESPDGRLSVSIDDPTLGREVKISADLVVLAEPMLARADSAELAAKLGISRTADNFFREAHPKLRPLDTPTDGVFLAGVAQGPRDIAESIVQGSGAAARATIPISKGRVEIEPIIAQVDVDLCGGCKICESLCEYGAINVEEDEAGKMRAKVTEAACKGCGVCGAACPTKAITMLHFTNDQVMAQVRAALREEVAT